MGVFTFTYNARASFMKRLQELLENDYIYRQILNH